ncbi:hypothetical protein KW783_00810 [Candidatus Parcubacteria bacterium]|nr:hypothetical protein [Candidatus Parcubacteria bacterium]
MFEKKWHNLLVPAFALSLLLAFITFFNNSIQETIGNYIITASNIAQVFHNRND